jgi:N-acetylneuraminic acid mutarotase
MPIWTQVGDNRVSSIPPDGRTIVDVYAIFSFSNSYIPEGTKINFLIGKGRLPENKDDEQIRWTLQMIFESISPIKGVQLISDDGTKGYQSFATVKQRVVRMADETLGVLPVAKCSISPIADVLEGEITVVAYTDYDKSGKIKRLQPSEAFLTVMSGKGTFIAVAERYDPLIDEWQTVAPMNTGRAGLFCEAISGKIYAAGGFAGNFIDAVEEYDPTSNVWTNKTALPLARGYGGSVVHNGKLYTVGGYNFDPGRASKFVHSYDPVLDEWTRLADTPLPVSHGCAEVIGDNIYLLFGATEFKEQNGKDEAPKSFNFGIFKYDINTDSWSVEDVDTSPVSVPASSTLSSAVVPGDVVIKIPKGALFPAYGIATIDRAGTKETVLFSSFDSTLGELRLRSPLTLAHSSGDTIVMVSLPETRLSPNSFVDGNVIKICNGMSYAGLTAGANVNSFINTTVASYNTVTKQFSKTATSPILPRLRAADTLISVGGSDRLYIVGGSAEKSDFLNELEYYDVSGTAFVNSLTDMLYSRHSLGAVSLGGYIYAIGGGGSGHPPEIGRASCRERV